MGLFPRAALSAVFLVFSYPPFSLWPLAFAAFILFLWPLVKQDPAFFKAPNFKKFLYFFTFMGLSYAGGFYWLAYTLHEFASFNWVLSSFLACLIFVLFSIFFGLLGPLGSFLQKKLKIKMERKIPITLLWIAMMLLWDFLDPKAFPWSPVKALGADRILLASVGVLKTVGWKILFWALVAYLVIEVQQFSFKKGQARYRIITVLALFFSSVYGIGLYQISHLKKIFKDTQPVALIQGNVGNYEKKSSYLGVAPTVKNVMAIHRDLIEKAAIHLSTEVLETKKEPWIAWPETSFPGFPLGDQKMAEDLARWVQLTRGLHMVGAYELAEYEYGGIKEEKDYNIVALFHAKKGYLGHYQKRIRMPFGEYVPGEDLWPSAYDYFPVNHFGKGKDLTLLAHPDPRGPVFIPVICYEVLKEGLLNDFVKKAQKEYPGRELILLNPSNDSWYGETSEPFHHSLLSRWESSRLELSLLRPTNTGMSQVVAPWGEVLSSGPRNKSVVIFGSLPVRQAVRDPELK